jgi:hypothetical protein
MGMPNRCAYQYFIASAVWPVLSVSLRLPQQPKADPDHA